MWRCKPLLVKCKQKNIPIIVNAFLRPLKHNSSKPTLLMIVVFYSPYELSVFLTVSIVKDLQYSR